MVESHATQHTRRHGETPITARRNQRRRSVTHHQRIARADSIGPLDLVANEHGRQVSEAGRLDAVAHRLALVRDPRMAGRARSAPGDASALSAPKKQAGTGRLNSERPPWLRAAGERFITREVRMIDQQNTAPVTKADVELIIRLLTAIREELGTVARDVDAIDRWQRPYGDGTRETSRPARRSRRS